MPQLPSSPPGLPGMPDVPSASQLPSSPSLPGMPSMPQLPSSLPDVGGYQPPELPLHSGQGADLFGGLPGQARSIMAGRPPALGALGPAAAGPAAYSAALPQLDLAQPGRAATALGDELQSTLGELWARHPGRRSRSWRGKCTTTCASGCGSSMNDVGEAHGRSHKQTREQHARQGAHRQLPERARICYLYVQP
jgi:hypothetical protein